MGPEPALISRTARSVQPTSEEVTSVSLYIDGAWAWSCRRLSLASIRRGMCSHSHHHHHHHYHHHHHHHHQPHWRTLGWRMLHLRRWQAGSPAPTSQLYRLLIMGLAPLLPYYFLLIGIIFMYFHIYKKYPHFHSGRKRACMWQPVIRHVCGGRGRWWAL